MLLPVVLESVPDQRDHDLENQIVLRFEQITNYANRGARSIHRIYSRKRRSSGRKSGRKKPRRKLEGHPT